MNEKVCVSLTYKYDFRDSHQQYAAIYVNVPQVHKHKFSIYCWTLSDKRGTIRPSPRASETLVGTRTDEPHAAINRN